MRQVVIYTNTTEKKLIYLLNLCGNMRFSKFEVYPSTGAPIMANFPR